MPSALPHQRTTIRAGGDLGARGLPAPLLPPTPDPDRQSEEDDVDDDDHDVADLLIRDGEREVTAVHLWLEQAEGSVDDLLLGPVEVLVGVLDPTVRDDAERDEHRREGVDPTEHRFTPTDWRADGATLAVGDDGERH